MKVLITPCPPPRCRRIAAPAFRAIRKKTNSEDYGGMPLLGVNGVCIIAHGGSSPLAMRNAIRMAGEAIRHHVNPHIIEEVQRYESTAAAHPQPSV
jgi:glycerol-3-phosphate acyltransferase PlsX